MLQFQWIHTIILDRVPGAHDLRVLHARDGAQHVPLHVLRQGRGHTLHIVLIGILPFRLQEQLMTLFIRKSHDFVLDRGAISGADTLDHTAEKGRAVQVRPDDLVRFFIRIG